MNNLFLQIIKFGIVGFASFFIDYFLLILFTDLFGIHYLISSALSFTISLIFNYLCSMKFVFERKDDISRKKEFILFCILSIMGLIINEICMFIGVSFFNLSYKFVKIIATVIVMFWNFVSRKILLEKKKS